MSSGYSPTRYLSRYRLALFSRAKRSGESSGCFRLSDCEGGRGTDAPLEIDGEAEEADSEPEKDEADAADLEPELDEAADAD